MDGGSQPGVASGDVAVVEQLLLHLRCRNYRIIEDLDIAIPRGLVGILGPNGTGKTSVFEAIGVALYGADATRTTVDDLVGPAGPTAMTELDFAFGGRVYRVHREFGKKPSAILTREGDELPVAATITGVNSAIVAMLKGYRELTLSRSVRQKQIDEMSNVGGPERRRLMLRLLGQSIVEDAIKGMIDAIKRFKADIEARRGILPDLVEIDGSLADERVALVQAGSDIAAAAVEIGICAVRRDEAAALLSLWNAAAEAAATQAATLGLVAGSLRDLDSEQTALFERGKDLEGDFESELAAFETDIARVDAARPEMAALEEAKALRDRVVDLDARLATTEVRRAEQQRLLQEVVAKAGEAESLAESEARLGRGHSDETMRHASLSAALGEARASYKRVSSEIDRLVGIDADASAVARCPVCEQPLKDPAAIANHIARLREENERLAAEGARLRTDDDASAMRVASLARDLDGVRERSRAATAATAEARLMAAALADMDTDLTERRAERAAAASVPYDADRHARLVAADEAYPGWITSAAHLQAKIDRREALAEDGKRIAERRATLDRQMGAARAAAEAAGYDQDAHAAARAGAAEAADALSSTLVRQAELTGTRALVESRISGLEGRRATHQRLVDEIAALVQRQRDTEVARETMDRFKGHLIGRSRPLLARRASTLLRELTDGRYTDLSLDDDYEISIGVGTNMRPIKGASGGEQDIASLCLRLAISELINETTGVGKTWVVLDEVMGSQDDQRRDALMTVLPRLATHFAQVLMIAHNSDVHDRFPTVIETRFDPSSGLSVIYYPAR